MIDSDIRTLFEEALGDDTPAYPTPDEDVARGRRLRRRRHLRNGLVGAAVLTVASILVTIWPGLPGQQTPIASDQSAETATTIDNPYLLIADSDWTITRASVGEWGGSVSYSSGAEHASISWGSSGHDSSLVAEYRELGYDETSTTVLGHDASVFELPRGELSEVVGYFAFWQEGAREVSLSTATSAIDDFDLAVFENVIDNLRQVDPAEWRRAVDVHLNGRTYDNTGAVAELAADLPVPNTFANDIGADRLSSVEPTDDVALKTGVAHWAACHWVRAWVHEQPIWAGTDSDAVDVTDELTSVVDWAERHDAVTDESVWDFAYAIIAGGDTINGNSMARYAPDYLRCGGW